MVVAQYVFPLHPPLCLARNQFLPLHSFHLSFISTWSFHQGDPWNTSISVPFFNAKSTRSFGLVMAAWHKHSLSSITKIDFKIRINYLNNDRCVTNYIFMNGELQSHTHIHACIYTTDVLRITFAWTENFSRIHTYMHTYVCMHVCVYAWQCKHVCMYA
jgi:hypothetical protein